MVVVVGGGNVLHHVKWEGNCPGGGAGLSYTRVAWHRNAPIFELRMVKVKVWTLVIAPLTCVRLVTRD